MLMNFDVLIIGSGFGGAITGCRLAEKGYKVLILERGRRWDKTNFPSVTGRDWLWDHANPEKLHGWLDLRMFPHMAVAAGAAVGGGSLIYANISAVPPPDVFNYGWPKEITHTELKDYFAAVGQSMNVQEVPDNQLTDRAKVVKIGAEKIGELDRFKKLTLAVSFDSDWNYGLPDAHDAKHSKAFVNDHGATQGTCVHQGYCDIGCPVLAKNTLDLNYLYSAENKYHAEVRSLHLVDNIEPIDGGYRVTYDDLDGGHRKRGSATARIVIVAAGSLGSTELLLKCRDLKGSLPKLSPFLGHNWSSNGDFLTLALGTKFPCSPTKGPTISAAIDFSDGSIKGSDGCPNHFWIQDGGMPDVVLPNLSRMAGQVLRLFGARELLDQLNSAVGAQNPLKHVMPWFAQGRDAANGKLSLRRRWGGMFGSQQLYLDWDITESEKTMIAIVETHKKLSVATGGVPTVDPTWSIGSSGWLDRFTWVLRRYGRNLITPHPLGGCNMGDSPETGVVNHAGEVHGYRNLYVADGSIFPEALGVNPSRTIGALAERIAKIIATDAR
jgi:cholesterol oxidase